MFRGCTYLFSVLYMLCILEITSSYTLCVPTWILFIIFHSCVILTNYYTTFHSICTSQCITLPWCAVPCSALLHLGPSCGPVAASPHGFGIQTCCVSEPERTQWSTSSQSAPAGTKNRTGQCLRQDQITVDTAARTLAGGHQALQDRQHL